MLIYKQQLWICKLQPYSWNKMLCLLVGRMSATRWRSCLRVIVLVQGVLSAVGTWFMESVEAV